MSSSNSPPPMLDFWSFPSAPLRHVPHSSRLTTSHVSTQAAHVDAALHAVADGSLADQQTSSRCSTAHRLVTQDT